MIDQYCPANIVVAVCTYRRPHSLRLLLEELAKQVFINTTPPQLELLIVDNDCDEKIRHLCESFRSRYESIALHYVKEPRTGISYARNTVLDRVPGECDYLALIDDDELPDPHWLDELLTVQRATGADIVRGPVKARYPADTPPWIIAGEYYGWPKHNQQIRNGQTLDRGASNNVLLKWPVIRSTGVRFDPRLAHTGGEDTVFFHHLLHKHKLTMVYAEKAAVTEIIPKERTTLPALLRLHYRLGANRLLKKRLQHTTRENWPKILALHVGKGIYHLTSGLAGLLACWLPRGGGRIGAMNSLFRLARGTGHIMGILGVRYRYY